MGWITKIRIVLGEVAERIGCLYRTEATRRRFASSGLDIQKPFEISGPDNLKFDSPVYIGPHAWLQLRDELRIGKGTIVGPRLTVLTGNHQYEGGGFLIPRSTYASRSRSAISCG